MKRMVTGTWLDNTLIRHLGVVLAIKLMVLFGLWWAFFRVPAQHLQPLDVSSHIAGESLPVVPSSTP